ncbi:hypothetical protein RchiOBHm_Chr1g0347201 [Rosa chinensis]|uniref:Uncharacterized protein n=1 Tax=Rosa chinensis TaxID=74649 RepID=A0A2P6SF79_ROSCH|nr:hypothetical protein RchiOBHm_Chr1g0347201 [Rosa chinensis]
MLLEASCIFKLLSFRRKERRKHLYPFTEKSIKLLMDKKQKAEKSLKIEKEMTQSQANELASLRHATLSSILVNHLLL